LERSFTAMGFSVTGGGSHPHLGTRNRIIILGEGYIELLAIADPANASPTLRRRIAHGAAWVGFALQSADIVDEVAAARSRGADARGPTPGRLVAPDGATRSWRVVTFVSDDLWAAALPLPFLIQHDSAGERHQRELAGGATWPPHPNGAHWLDGVTIWTNQLSALRQDYERAYSPSVTATGDAITLYRLEPSGEWISLRQSPSATQPATASHDAGDPLMRVTVGVSDLARVHDLASHSGLTWEAGADDVTISLPGAQTAVTFIAATLSPS
ncbi:MAG TPA: VOC family protein, partial [Ktedonobacterales bacterium]